MLTEIVEIPKLRVGQFVPALRHDEVYMYSLSVHATKVQTLKCSVKDIDLLLVVGPIQKMNL